MKNIPRILPLVGVAAAGVLAINALNGARMLPELVSGARAFAEGVAKPEARGKAAVKPKAGGLAKTEAHAVSAEDAAVDAGTQLPAAKAAPVCAPTAAELAKAAGLSPAELQVLQSLGSRRGQLDQREADMGTQLALLAAAEAKLDAKLKALTGLKADIQGLMGQGDAKQQAELDRMVKVFEGMKPKDAAPRMVLLDDAVRLPIAAKMKERALSAILSQMAPMEAKRLTESLANRYTAGRAVASAADKAASPASATVPARSTPSVDPTANVADAKPTKAPVKKPAARKAVAKKPAAEPTPQAGAEPAPQAKAEPAKAVTAVKPG